MQARELWLHETLEYIRNENNTRGHIINKPSSTEESKMKIRAKKKKKATPTSPIKLYTNVCVYASTEERCIAFYIIWQVKEPLHCM